MKRTMLTILVLGLAALVLPAFTLPDTSAQAQETLTLDSVLARFRSIPGMQASFREEKVIGLLAVPLVTEGVIHFAPPGRLARHVTTPAPSSMVLNGRDLTLGDERGSRSIALDESPAVAVFVESFVHLLSGDREALSRNFEITFEAQARDFTITLRPKSVRVRRMVGSIVVSGDDTGVTRLVVSETSGDVSTTTFTEIDNARRYERADLTRLFQVRR